MYLEKVLQALVVVFNGLNPHKVMAYIDFAIKRLHLRHTVDAKPSRSRRKKRVETTSRPARLGVVGAQHPSKRRSQARPIPHPELALDAGGNGGLPRQR